MHRWQFLSEHQLQSKAKVFCLGFLLAMNKLSFLRRITFEQMLCITFSYKLNSSPILSFRSIFLSPAHRNSRRLICPWIFIWKPTRNVARAFEKWCINKDQKQEWLDRPGKWTRLIAIGRRAWNGNGQDVRQLEMMDATAIAERMEGLCKRITKLKLSLSNVPNKLFLVKNQMSASQETTLLQGKEGARINYVSNYFLIIFCPTNIYTVERRLVSDINKS